jgi:hypothetical protein
MAPEGRGVFMGEKSQMDEQKESPETREGIVS